MTAMTREAAFWAFFRFCIFCTSFREKSSRRERIPAAYTKSLYILHCIQFAQMCNYQAMNAKIFSHRACRLPFCSPLATYRTAVAGFPGATPIPNCFVQNGNKANSFLRHSFLYPRVLFCIFLFFYCNSASASV